MPSVVRRQPSRRWCWKLKTVVSREGTTYGTPLKEPSSSQCCCRTSSSMRAHQEVHLAAQIETACVHQLIAPPSCRVRRSWVLAVAGHCLAAMAAPRTHRRWADGFADQQYVLPLSLQGGHSLRPSVPRPLSPRRCARHRLMPPEAYCCGTAGSPLLALRKLRSGCARHTTGSGTAAALPGSSAHGPAYPLASRIQAFTSFAWWWSHASCTSTHSLPRGEGQRGACSALEHLPAPGPEASGAALSGACFSQHAPQRRARHRLGHAPAAFACAPPRPAKRRRCFAPSCPREGRHHQGQQPWCPWRLPWAWAGLPYLLPRQVRLPVHSPLLSSKSSHARLLGAPHPWRSGALGDGASPAPPSVFDRTLCVELLLPHQGSDQSGDSAGRVRIQLLPPRVPRDLPTLLQSPHP
jgi:hypothetical protein